MTKKTGRPRISRGGVKLDESLKKKLSKQNFDDFIKSEKITALIGEDRFKALPPKDQAILLKSEQPNLRVSEIAKILGIKRTTVSDYIKNFNPSKEVQKTIEESFRAEVNAIVNKCLKWANGVMDDPKAPATVKGRICDLFLRPRIEKMGEMQAEQIIFETYISDTGVLERSIKKVYQTSDSG